MKYEGLNGYIIVNIIDNVNKKEKDNNEFIMPEKKKLNAGLVKAEVLNNIDEELKKGDIVYFKKEYAIKLDELDEIYAIEIKKIIVKEVI